MAWHRFAISIASKMLWFFEWSVSGYIQLSNKSADDYLQTVIDRLRQEPALLLAQVASDSMWAFSSAIDLKRATPCSECASIEPSLNMI